MTFVGSLAHNGPGKADLIVETILLFFDYVTLGLRLWSRRIKGIGLQANDWLIIAATYLMTARYAGELCAIFLGGLGLHVTEVLEVGGPEAFVKFLKVVYAVDLLWITTNTLIKLSILHFYVQIFHIEKKFVYACYVTIGLCILYWAGSFFHFAFYCTPIQKSWRPALPGKCGKDNIKYIMWGSIDLIIDSIIISLPMPILKSLQMPMMRKIGLMGVFALGLGVIAITGIRFKFYKEADLNDVTYSFWGMALFAAMVPLLGIISANIPVIPPAFQRIFKSNIFATQAKSSRSRSTSTGSRVWSTKKKGGESRFDENEFDRLSDPDIPLVNVQGGRSNQSANSGNNRIQVTTDWRVQSSPNEV